MKNNLKLVFIIIVIAFTFLICGIYMGKYIFDANSDDNEILSDNIDDNTSDNIDDNISVDINVDIDIGDKRVVLGLGKYLYFLAEAVNFNCFSDYFDTTIIDNDVILNNYDKLKNSFSDEFIKNNNMAFFDGINSDSGCYVMMDNGKINVDNCWCGRGGPLNTINILESFEISSINENEITYSIVIKEYNGDSEYKFNFGNYTNTYNDSFTIKKIDNEWKIDKYTYRYISYQL